MNRRFWNLVWIGEDLSERAGTAAESVRVQQRDAEKVGADGEVIAIVES